MQHIELPDVPIHPVFVPVFIVLNIFLMGIPVKELGEVAHVVVYTSQFIAAGMAAVASYYAIRHYRSIYKTPNP